MKLVFVYWAYENAGSMLDLSGYTRAARALGHEVTVYGAPNPKIALNYSQDLTGADAIVFVFEWTTCLQFGGRLDWVRLVEAVPRCRRVVIDCDGAYNDPIEFEGDYNHTSTVARMSWSGGKDPFQLKGNHDHDREASSRSWVQFCDSLSDKIYQPTFWPRRANVRTFLFHLYDPTWEAPLDFAAKEFSMVYVGHTKFRWRGMSRVLRALGPVRDRIGRVALVGEGWAGIPAWIEEAGMRDNFYIDPLYLKKLRVEALPPVPFREVIATMSRGVFNPVVYRPLFEHLGMVTCRTFETPAAGTIPLFVLNAEYVREIYGERAVELVLGGERPHEKVLEVLTHPDHYAEVVREIRQEFARRHSPEARLRELIEIIQR
jgi:glycosyltransferase involved in cell wall biosynthesis